MTAFAHQPDLHAEFRHGASGTELYFNVRGRGRYLIARQSEVVSRDGNVLKIAPETTRTYSAIQANIESAKARGLPHIDNQPLAGGMVSICGPGPSLVHVMDCIATDRKRGAQIWALKATWRVLTARGIVPDAVVMMDAHPCQVAYTSGAPPMQWLLASMMHPDVLDALADEDVILWDAPEGKGVSVGAHAALLALLRGYSDIRLYGFDCSWIGERTHLYELANRQAAEKAEAIDVLYAGHRYQSTREMCVEARQIMRLIEAPKGPRIVPCGQGLLPDLFRGQLWRRT